jgi:hypothetical protein
VVESAVVAVGIGEAVGVAVKESFGVGSAENAVGMPRVVAATSANADSETLPFRALSLLWVTAAFRVWGGPVGASGDAARATEEDATAISIGALQSLSELS